MTAFVAGNDLQPGPNRESNSRHERIPKPNAVYVLAARSDDEFAARFVGGQESIENSQVDVGRWSDFGRSGPCLLFGEGSAKLRINQRPNHPGVICSTGESGLSLSAAEIDLR
jgi:hypothetical protein